MNMIVSISLGAVIGALSRHYMMASVARLLGTNFPWGTLLINVLGSLLMGILIELLALKLSLSQELRALLTVGILGSFTTFSTFSMETALLIQRGDFTMAILYSLGSVVIGVGALFIGIYMVRILIG